MWSALVTVLPEACLGLSRRFPEEELGRICVEPSLLSLLYCVSFVPVPFSHVPG